ncbi:MAG TPA: CvpA family protein [Bacteroidales bacterium]|nr:CvpA family protein [Bacteroidales bacterium]
MVAVDILIAVILLIFAYKGFKNGLIKELGSLIALIAGIFIAIRFSDLVGSLITKNSGFSSEYMPVISFTIIFLAVVILILVFSKILDRFVKVIKLQWLNKTAGVVFSILKTIIIIGGLLFSLSRFNERMNMFDPTSLQNTICYKPCVAVFEFIFPYAEHLYQLG